MVEGERLAKRAGLGGLTKREELGGFVRGVTSTSTASTSSRA